MGDVNYTVLILLKRSKLPFNRQGAGSETKFNTVTLNIWVAVFFSLPDVLVMKNWLERNLVMSLCLIILFHAKEILITGILFFNTYMHKQTCYLVSCWNVML